LVDKPITPHWSSWTKWTVHKRNKAQKTTTYVSRRFYWVPKHPTDPKKGSKITKTDVRYKTEKTPRMGEPGGTPSKPSPITPVKKEPTPEYVEPTSETVTEHLVSETKGKHVVVEYRTPEGVAKRVRTSDLKSLLPSLQGGIVLSIRGITPAGKPGKTYYAIPKDVPTGGGMVSLHEEGKAEVYEDKPEILSPVKTIPVKEKDPGIVGMLAVTALTVPKVTSVGLHMIGPEKIALIEHQLTAPIHPKYKDFQSYIRGEQEYIQKMSEYSKGEWERFLEPETVEPQMQVTDDKLWYEPKKEGPDWMGLIQRGLQHPAMFIPTAYGLGAGMGAFKATTFGGKKLFQIGFIQKGPIGGAEYYLTATITPAKILETTIFGYGGYKTIESGMKDFKGTIKNLAFTLPFMIGPYKWGYKAGYGYIQRKAALSKLTGLDRVRQQAIYDSWKAIDKMHEPYLRKKLYDLTNIKKVSDEIAMDIGYYLTSEQKRWILGGQPRLGGSGAMKIQMGKYFRTGDYPASLRTWAEARQYQAWLTGRQAGSQPFKLVGPSPPVDVDFLALARLGGLKRTGYLKQFDVHVHPYKIGDYLWGGTSQLPSTKGYIVDPYYAGMTIDPLSYTTLKSFLGKQIWGMTYPGVPYTQLHPAFLPKAMKFVPPKIWKKYYFPEGIKTLKHELIHQKYPSWSERTVEFGTQYGFQTLETAAKGWYKTGKIIIPKEIKLLGIREQHIRSGISILPSETPITGYRTYKDVGTWYDTGDVLRFQKFGTEFSVAMDKFIHPTKYPIPKVTFAEKFIGKIATGKFFEKLPTGDFRYIMPTYPKYTGYGLGFMYGMYGDFPTIKYEPSYVPSELKMSIPYYKPSPTITPYKLPPSVVPYKPPSVTPYKPPLPYKYKTPSVPSPYVPPPPYTPPPTPPPYTPPPPYKTPPYVPPPPYTPPPPKKTRIPMGEGIRRIPKSDKGYTVMVKTRQYVHGKPRGSEKFRPLNKRPLSYNDAMSLMGSALDHSIAQSGFLKPSDKPAKTLHKRIPSRWDTISHKFGIKKGRYIEGRPYAIDTRGEQQELDVYRWYQRLPVKKTGKPKARVIEGYPGLDMYGFDKMQMDFDRMLRGLVI